MPKYNLPVIESLPPELPNGKKQRRRVVVVTNPQISSLEYMGVLQIFDEARLFLEHAGRPDLGYDIEVVATQTGNLYSRKGMDITASTPYHKVRGKVDTLILQAVDELDETLNDERFINWVKIMSTRVRRIASVCTGTFILAQAGLLDGKRATTHWCATDDFESKFPNVALDPNPIYIKQGNVYTSAGATSGMDMTIAFLEEDYGPEFARRVAQGMVMYLRRPGNQAQFSVHLPDHVDEASKMNAVRSHIDGNLNGNLRVDALAEYAHMSPRNFTRIFTRDVGMTPGQYVEQCRLERARQLMEQTELSIGHISDQCGYTSPDGLRLAFLRHMEVTPREYRRRFASATG